MPNDLVAEEQRLEQARLGIEPWKKWGPYLAERQWGMSRLDIFRHPFQFGRRPRFVTCETSIRLQRSLDLVRSSEMLCACTTTKEAQDVLDQHNASESGVRRLLAEGAKRQS